MKNQWESKPGRSYGGHFLILSILFILSKPAFGQTPVTFSTTSATLSPINRTTIFTPQVVGGVLYPNVIFPVPVVCNPSNGVVNTNLLSGFYSISFVGWPRTLHVFVPDLWVTNLPPPFNALPVNLALPNWQVNGGQLVFIQTNFLTITNTITLSAVTNFYYYTNFVNITNNLSGTNFALLTNAIPSVSSGVSVANQTVSISTNYDALGAANAIGQAVTNAIAATNAATSVALGLIGLNLTNAIAATNATTLAALAGTNTALLAQIQALSAGSLGGLGSNLTNAIASTNAATLATALGYFLNNSNRMNNALTNGAYSASLGDLTVGQVGLISGQAVLGANGFFASGPGVDFAGNALGLTNVQATNLVGPFPQPLLTNNGPGYSLPSASLNTPTLITPILQYSVSLGSNTVYATSTNLIGMIWSNQGWTYYSSVPGAWTNMDDSRYAIGYGGGSLLWTSNGTTLALIPAPNLQTNYWPPTGPGYAGPSPVTSWGGTNGLVGWIQQGSLHLTGSVTVSGNATISGTITSPNITAQLNNSPVGGVLQGVETNAAFSPAGSNAIQTIAGATTTYATSAGAAGTANELFEPPWQTLLYPGGTLAFRPDVSGSYDITFGTNGAIMAAGYTGNGSGLTGLNASALSSGTVPLSQMPGTLESSNTIATFSMPPNALSQFNSALETETATGRVEVLCCGHSITLGGITYPSDTGGCDFINGWVGQLKAFYQQKYGNAGFGLVPAWWNGISFSSGSPNWEDSGAGWYPMFSFTTNTSFGPFPNSSTPCLYGTNNSAGADFAGITGTYNEIKIIFGVNTNSASTNSSDVYNPVHLQAWGFASNFYFNVSSSYNEQWQTCDARGPLITNDTFRIYPPTNSVPFFLYGVELYTATNGVVFDYAASSGKTVGDFIGASSNGVPIPGCNLALAATNLALLAGVIQPALTFFEFDANDFKLYTPLTNFFADYATAIQPFTNYGSVVLLGDPPRDPGSFTWTNAQVLYHDQMRALIPFFKNNIGMVDLLPFMGTYTNMVQRGWSAGDGVHMSIYGHDQAASVILQGLGEAGVLPLATFPNISGGFTGDFTNTFTVPLYVTMTNGAEKVAVWNRYAVQIIPVAANPTTFVLEPNAYTTNLNSGGFYYSAQ